MKNICKLLVLCLLISSALGCTPGNQATVAPSTSPSTNTPTTAPQFYVGPISWELTVTGVSSIGQVLAETEKFTITIEGELHGEVEDGTVLDIEISFPEHFPYILPASDDGFLSIHKLFTEPGSYRSTAFVLDKSGRLQCMYFVIDAINGLAIFHFEDTGHFYVASVDHSTDPTAIYEHFHYFVEHMNK